MDDETLLALMTKIDPMTARVPPGIRQIVDAVIAYEREACAKVAPTELIAKLRSYRKTSGYASVMDKAADEIERLRAILSDIQNYAHKTDDVRRWCDEGLDGPNTR